MIVIAIDGVDYSGKSKLAGMLKETLEAARYDVVIQPFPTNDGHGAKARLELANGGDPLVVAHHIELNFLEVSREILAEAADDNTIYILDRYVTTTYAHQNHIIDISSGEYLIPDIQIVMTIDHSVMLDRKKERGGVDWDKTETDKYSKEEAWNTLNVRYDTAGEFLVESQDIEHYFSVDGTDDKEELVEDIVNTLMVLTAL